MAAAFQNTFEACRQSKLFVSGLLETTHTYLGTPEHLHKVIHHLNLLFKSRLLHRALEGRFYANFANWEDEAQGKKQTHTAFTGIRTIAEVAPH